MNPGDFVLRAIMAASVVPFLARRMLRAIAVRAGIESGHFSGVGKNARSRMALAAIFALLGITSAFRVTNAFAESGHDVAVALFDPDDFVLLSSEPGDELVGVPVENASGAVIGTVKTVDPTPHGSARRVLVGLHTGASAWIDAHALRYNQNAHILLTNLKDTELSQP